VKWFFGLLVLSCLVAYIVMREPGAQPHDSVDSSQADNSRLDSSVRQRQYTILLDVSASRPESMIQEGEVYVDEVIDRMNYGDQLLLLQMYEENVNEPKQPLLLLLSPGKASLSLNPADDLTRNRKALKDTVQIFFSRADANRAPHTDILTTLSIASEQMSRDKDNALIILSDMLQSSSEWEFDHLKHMPPDDWIDRRKNDGLIRPLYGACVVAVGADPSTQEGVKVRDFWQRYFAASDASLSTQDFRTSPISTDSKICS
jgi:hypothetical protein